MWQMFDENTLTTQVRRWEMIMPRVVSLLLLFPLYSVFCPCCLPITPLSLCLLCLNCFSLHFTCSDVVYKSLLFLEIWLHLTLEVCFMFSVSSLCLNLHVCLHLFSNKTKPYAIVQYCQTHLRRLELQLEFVYSPQGTCFIMWIISLHFIPWSWVASFSKKCFHSQRRFADQAEMALHHPFDFTTGISSHGLATRL